MTNASGTAPTAAKADVAEADVAGASGAEAIEPLAMTEAAAARLEVLAEREGTPLVGVRVKVKGGGCSGLSYDLGLESEAREGDLIFGDHPKLFVDPKSYRFVKGLVLDFRGNMAAKAFVFDNPNATKTCGCGSSFSV